MKLIVGLGNPGKKYENTRHNIGFEVVEKLTSEPWKTSKKFDADVADGKIGSEKIILLKPQTFMNESGRAVALATNFYKIKSADILVIHDDIDLPLGKIRISGDSSSAGHRGVESIIATLGTKKFLRLRVGVAPGARPKNFDAVKFVLKKFGKSEEKILTETIKKTTEAVAVLLTSGAEIAMNQFN